MSFYDSVFDLRINVGHFDLYYIFWSSEFALYLENYSVVEHYTGHSCYVDFVFLNTIT